MTEAWLVMENAYVANHVTFSAVVAAAWGTAASAEAQDVPNPDKCGGQEQARAALSPFPRKHMAKLAMIPLRFSMRL